MKETIYLQIHKYLSFYKPKKEKSLIWLLVSGFSFQSFCNCQLTGEDDV